MITLEKLKIFSRYNGDVDMWVRAGKFSEKKIMVSDDWYLIDNFIQQIGLVNKSLTSEKFKSDLNKRLMENCDSVDAIEFIKSMK